MNAWRRVGKKEIKVILLVGERRAFQYDESTVSIHDGKESERNV